MKIIRSKTNKVVLEVHPDKRRKDYKPKFTCRRVVDGPLHDLLCERFPKYLNKEQVLDLPRIATDMGTTRQSVFKWLAEDRVTWNAAKRLVSFGKGKITNEDLIPFMI